jgi:hypothetical protein
MEMGCVGILRFEAMPLRFVALMGSLWGVSIL